MIFVFIPLTTKTRAMAVLPSVPYEPCRGVKLKVIADRGELRVYFDILTIEQETAFNVEADLDFFVERYRSRIPRQAVAAIVLGLGYLDDVADDPTFP